MSSLPYEGLKVLDTSQGLAGPYCGSLLAQYGAEVIKVEGVGGDWSRALGKAYGDNTALSVTGNLGKKGLALDIKSTEGLDIVLDFADKADVFLESSRPGVAERLGLDAPTLMKRNPRLIYLSVSGFGQVGPHSTRPATDTMAQAYSGLVAMNKGVEGTPHRVPIMIPDTVAGLYGFQNVSVALYGQAKNNVGRFIDLSLTQSAAAFQTFRLSEYHLESGIPSPLNEPTGTHQTADGWMAVALVKEEQYQRFCEAIGAPELITDPKFSTFEVRGQNKAELLGIIKTYLIKRPTNEWTTLLTKADVIAEKVYDYGDWMDDPHTQETGEVRWVDQPHMGKTPIAQTPGKMTKADLTSPQIGEHSREILLAAGYSADQIDDLKSRKIVFESEL